jgi:hypothetical protein
MSVVDQLRALRPGLLLRTVLAVYVAAVALLPLSHHDVVCHLKSPTHCTSCLVGSSGEPGTDAAALLRVAVSDQGRLLNTSTTLVASIPHGASAGRSPPVRG